MNPIYCAVVNYPEMKTNDAMGIGLDCESRKTAWPSGPKRELPRLEIINAATAAIEYRDNQFFSCVLNYQFVAQINGRIKVIIQIPS